MADSKSKDERPFVAPADGPEHGFYGSRPDNTPNADFTVAGVTGGTTKTSDTPKATKSSPSKS